MAKRTRKPPRPRSAAQALFAAAETLLKERTNETSLRAVLENGLGAKFVWNEHAQDVATTATTAICAAAKLSVRGQEIPKVTLGKDEATARLHRLLASAQQFARRQRIGASHLRLAIKQLTDEDKAQKKTTKGGPESQTSSAASASEAAPSASESGVLRTSNALSIREVIVADSRSSAGLDPPTQTAFPGQLADVWPDSRSEPPTTSHDEPARYESVGAQTALGTEVAAQHAATSRSREPFTMSALGAGLPPTASTSDALHRSQTVFSLKVTNAAGAASAGSTRTAQTSASLDALLHAVAAAAAAGRASESSFNATPVADVRHSLLQSQPENSFPRDRPLLHLDHTSSDDCTAVDVRTTTGEPATASSLLEGQTDVGDTATPDMDTEMVDVHDGASPFALEDAINSITTSATRAAVQVPPLFRKVPLDLNLADVDSLAIFTPAEVALPTSSELLNVQDYVWCDGEEPIELEETWLEKAAEMAPPQALKMAHISLAAAYSAIQAGNRSTTALAARYREEQAKRSRLEEELQQTRRLLASTQLQLQEARDGAAELKRALTDLSRLTSALSQPPIRSTPRAGPVRSNDENAPAKHTPSLHPTRLFPPRKALISLVQIANGWD